MSCPAEKPPIPFPATTRWHGIMIRIGFAPTAPPTARAAVGQPIRRAISPYVTTSPKGIVLRTSHTFCRKAVPSGLSGRSNSRRVPAKYSQSSPIARCVTGSGICSGTPPRKTEITNSPSDTAVSSPHGKIPVSTYFMEFPVSSRLLRTRM